MKLTSFALIIGIFTLTLSCQNNRNSVRDDARESLRDIPEGSVTPPASNGATLTSGVHHYICPNNCEGSGGPSAGTCPVCGSEYAHNDAYHNQPAGSSPMPTIQANPGALNQPSISTTPEPAQNAAGIWHYTCPKGCAGGAGSAGKCGTCGGDLAHNVAYHNQ